MLNRRCFRNPLILAPCLIMLLWLSPPARAQICGDANGDGFFDISDIASIFDYFAISEVTPPGLDNMEFDGHANVNVSDWLEFREWYETLPPTEPLLGCFPLQPPLSPVPTPGNLVAIEPSEYPPDFIMPLKVKLIIKCSSNLKGFAMPFHVMMGGSECQIVPGSIVAHSLPSLPYLSIKQAGNSLLIRGADPGGAPSGRYELMEFGLIGPFIPSPDPAPLTLELVPFPTPTNPHSGEPVNNPLFIFGEPGNREYTLPGVVTSIPCCEGLTGNVDCDNFNKTDISDISVLVDHLYVTLAPLCCPTAANCDGSADGRVDISDLSALDDYLYVSFTPTAPCL